MTESGSGDHLRCPRCGHLAAEGDKFCAECGMFLRDAFVDQRLLLAMVHEKEAAARMHGASSSGFWRSSRIMFSPIISWGSCTSTRGPSSSRSSVTKALSAAPEFVLGHYDLGVAWYHRGNMPRAIRAFRRCLEIDEHYNAAHYRLALSLFHAGHLDEALDHFEQAIALTPEYLMANYHMGVIHERRQEPERSRALLSTRYRRARRRSQ